MIVVGLSSPSPSYWYMEKGSRLILAPKSSNAFSTQVPPMLTKIVEHRRSLYFTGVLHSMMALTCLVKKAFLFTLKPLFTVHRSFKNFAYVGTCLIMSRRGLLTFTYRSTSKISVWLTEFFLFRSAYGKGWGTLCFTPFPVDSSSSSGSTTVGAFLAGSRTIGLSFVPLLNVTSTLTSSILALESLAEPISCIPLGFCCVWEGNFPFSRPCCWLDNLEMELCNLSYLLEILECMLFNFLSSELSTVSIF